MENRKEKSAEGMEVDFAESYKKFFNAETTPLNQEEHLAEGAFKVFSLYENAKVTYSDGVG